MKYTEEQCIKLAKLLNYLKTNNTYWAKKLDKWGNITLENVKEVYEAINVISKKEILQNLSDYLDYGFTRCFSNTRELEQYLLETKDLSNDNYKYFIQAQSNWIIETTTGTTGKPFPVVKSRKEIMIAGNNLLKCRRMYFEQATLDNGFLLAHEVDPKIKKMDFRSKSSKMHEVIDYYLEKKPQWMFVSANSLKKLTKAMLEYRTDEVREISLKFIEVTGAKLYDDDKIVINELFNCPIVNQYGCREAWNIAYECKAGNMHLNNDNILVDLVDEKGNSIDRVDCVGEVVITNLAAKVTPIIKYYLGDYASFSNKKCECGCEKPIIELKNGRKSERLVNTKYFGSHVFRIILRVLYFHKNIRYERVKIIQDQPYHLSVYIEECNNRKGFEEEFVEVSNNVIDNFYMFDISYYYEYPFENEEQFLKEQIFLCKLEG